MYTLPKVDPDKRLSVVELAALIGRRRQGKPTQSHTVSSWIRHGLGGVRLRADWDGCMWWTTWRWYQDWCRQRVRAREERVRRCQEAVRAARIPTRLERERQEKRQARAQQKLEEMGAI